MRIGGPGHPTCAPPAERQEITEVPALGCHSCAQRSAAEPRGNPGRWYSGCTAVADQGRQRSEEHTSELQSLMRISYAVFCLKKQKKQSNKRKKKHETAR